MKISLCMIVRNEEICLARALDSARGLVDEIVIVDTGSTDTTLEIAKEYGAIIITGASRYHMGQVRNQALSAATGDWTIVLDADESIADPVGVRRFIEETDAEAIYIKVVCHSSLVTFPSMRCWQRGAYHYEYRYHELPVPTKEQSRAAYTNFVWDHIPPPNRTWKWQYALDCLLLDVEEHPQDPRPLYYLGRQYMYMQRWQEAIDTLNLYLTQPNYDEADAWGNKAWCHGQLGETQEQIGALFRACAAQPERRDWWGALAEIYHTQGKDAVAAGLLKCALSLPPPRNTFVYHRWYGAHPHDLLARCLWRMGMIQEGRLCAAMALALAPDDERLRRNLWWFDERLMNNEPV